MGTSATALYKADPGIKIYAPTSSVGKGKYYRIVFRENGKYRDTTATSESLAIDAASKIAIRLKAGGDARSQLPVSEFVKAYLNEAVRSESGNSWGKKHSRSIRNLMNLYIVPEIGNERCDEITNQQLKNIVKAGKTVSNGEHLSRCLSAWIRWGSSEKWIIQNPDDLVKGFSKAYKKLNGVTNTAQSGETALFINQDEIPSHDDVAAVARAAAEISGIWWFELMFQLAAYSGLRLGEIIDLDLSSIDLSKKIIYVTHQCLEDAGNKTRTLPKLAKQRKTVYPSITPNGYELAKQLQRRVNEVKTRKLSEKVTLQSGNNRKLMFPNSKGDWLSQSYFAKRIRRPAQELVGWPRKSNGNFKWTFHSLRHVFCSYFLIDLKQKPTSVAIAAGHSSVITTLAMYVGVSQGAIEEMSAAS